MDSYNQTKKIMEELDMKINSVSSTESKKVFIVILEGTETEFEELRRLGAIEIENKNALLKLNNRVSSIKNRDCFPQKINLESKLISDYKENNKKYVDAGSVLTESDVAKLPNEVNEIILKERGMITPLARDLAKKRGIKIARHKT